MINKQFIKSTMPAVFNFVKTQPLLFRVAKGVERRLLTRQYNKTSSVQKHYSQ